MVVTVLEDGKPTIPKDTLREKLAEIFKVNVNVSLTASHMCTNLSNISFWFPGNLSLWFEGRLRRRKSYRICPYI